MAPVPLHRIWSLMPSLLPVSAMTWRRERARWWSIVPGPARACRARARGRARARVRATLCPPESVARPAWRDGGGHTVVAAGGSNLRHGAYETPVCHLSYAAAPGNRRKSTGLRGGRQAKRQAREEPLCQIQGRLLRDWSARMKHAGRLSEVGEHASHRPGCTAHSRHVRPPSRLTKLSLSRCRYKARAACRARPSPRC